MVAAKKGEEVMGLMLLMVNDAVDYIYLMTVP